MRTSAEEMELFAQVNKKFRQVFNRQESMKTFKTYDRVEVLRPLFYNFELFILWRARPALP